MIVVPVQAGVALVLARLSNKQVRDTTFFRTVYFLPVVTSVVVVPLQYLDEVAALNLPMAEVGRDTRRAVFVKPTHQPAPPAQPYTPPVK